MARQGLGAGVKAAKKTANWQRMDAGAECRVYTDGVCVVRVVLLVNSYGFCCRLAVVLNTVVGVPLIHSLRLNSGTMYSLYVWRDAGLGVWDSNVIMTYAHKHASCLVDCVLPCRLCHSLPPYIPMCVNRCVV